jgi:hypothetical protein
VSLDDKSLVLSTRNSNALDFALLIQDLVPLLEAYEHAWQSGDGQKRLELAGVICQGISPDPELFLNRVELFGAYSMIEHLFVTTDRDGHVVYTPMQLVAAHKADYYDEPHLLSDRREGKCLLSYKTPGGWVAITKAILTEVLGAGRDVKIVGLPPVAVGVLKLMCPNLVILPENVPPGDVPPS